MFFFCFFLFLFFKGGGYMLDMGRVRYMSVKEL